MNGAPLAAAAARDAQAGDEILAGTVLRPQIVHRDARGTISEFQRAEWYASPAAIQWTLTASEAGVLRGVHVHLRHHDYFVLMQGRCDAALRDLRRGSPTEGRVVQLVLDAARPMALSIPPGVAHGFYCPVPVHYALGVSEYYDLEDELGCHWRDPDLGIDWPVAEVRLSERDAALPRLRALMARIPPWTPA